jgi:HD-GYP domain-containing protein (c-di-GMP phosphodiesterase class II)
LLCGEDVPVTRPSPPVRLAELVATMSLVADLGMGRPLERVLRQTVVALRLAVVVDTDAEQRAAVYYASLLTWVGCAADTSDIAALFGEESMLYADTHDDDLAGLSLALFVARHLGGGSSALRRFGLVSRFLLTAGRSVQSAMEAHCLAAAELATRLDLGEHVRLPLLQAFERWDGRGVPGTTGGENLALPIRLVQLSDCIEAFHHTGGVEAALEVARQRRGTQFDPALVDSFVARHAEVLDGLDQLQAWDEVIALDPGLGVELAEDQLDRALEALADFADLKSPSRTSHSRAVAALAVMAGRRLGLSGSDVVVLRRAALVQDLGMIGISSAIWDSVQPWSLGQRERARTHPYLTERMLARLPALARVARLAGLHQERLDGSGYPYGLTGEATPLAARILAACDVYQALREPRPHRPPFADDVAARMLREEVAAGRLDRAVVDAVLVADGHRAPKRSALPGGLTSREAEVLVLLAHGNSNREIASALGVSRKTVSSHLEHVFTKLDVRTRTQAALFAMRHGLGTGVDAAAEPSFGR